MKKKFLLGMASVAMLAGGFGILRSNQTTAPELSPLQMQNIEALTNTETGTKMQCTYGIEYTGGYSMPLYCPTCVWKYGYVPTGSSGSC